MSLSVITRLMSMGRWEPDAAGRLLEAALELFSERGYEQTTVADIAQKAGVTERTFFRYYADKREVLFGGGTELEATVVASIAAAPSSAAPLEAVVAAISAIGLLLDERREFARRRAAVIASNASLQERELLKLAALSAAASSALRDRGAGAAEAALAAETGMVLFKVSFERWIAGPSARSIADYVKEAARELTALAAKL